MKSSAPSKTNIVIKRVVIGVVIVLAVLAVGRVVLSRVASSKLHAALADIHKIECTFKGDKHQMTEEFCMLYDNMKLQSWNDTSAPYKLVAKNSGFVSFLANLAVPKSNPSKPGKDPKTVEVTFKRDPMTPYPAYIIQNLTMGMLHTVLPGGAVHKNKK